MSVAAAVVATAAMVVCLFLVPLGLPGTWLMLLVVAVGALLGEVGWTTLAVLVLVAGAAEAVEFLLVRALSLRYGGSSRAFWGAVLGGLVGVFVGAPIPVAGSLVAGVIGTFLGAAVTALWETREVGSAARVGWGAVLGRAGAAAVKTAAGVVVLAVGIGTFFV